MANHQQFILFLDQMRDILGKIDFTPALRKCAVAIRKDVEKNFALERSPDDEEWPPRKDDEEHPLLDKTGKMFRAATKEYAEGNITEFSPEGMILGIDGEDVDYAIFHMTGTRYMPARKFFGASDLVKEECRQIIADFIKEKVLEEFDSREAA